MRRRHSPGSMRPDAGGSCVPVSPEVRGCGDSDNRPFTEPDLRVMRQALFKELYAQLDRTQQIGDELALTVSDRIWGTSPVPVMTLRCTSAAQASPVCCTRLNGHDFRFFLRSKTVS